MSSETYKNFILDRMADGWQVRPASYSPYNGETGEPIGTGLRSRDAARQFVREWWARFNADYVAARSERIEEAMQAAAPPSPIDEPAAPVKAPQKPGKPPMPPGYRARRSAKNRQARASRRANRR